MGRQVVTPERDAGASIDNPSAIPLPPQLVVAFRYHQVCRFWLEKAVLLTDGVQLFALMWQLSQPWPWPARWLQASRWTNAFNLDVFSFRTTGAAMGSTSQAFSVWGEMHHYWLYALAWALVPWGGVLTLHTAKKFWYRHGRSDFLFQNAIWENVLLQLLQFLYVPVGLAVLRLVNCNADGAVAVDPTNMGTCASAGHVIAVMLITCGLGGCFLLGLPWFLRRRIRESLSQSSVKGHERFLQARELEFMLGTSDTYLELYMPQYASFRRHSVEMPVQVCVLKLFLLIAFSILRSAPPSTANQGTQGGFFFFGVITMAIWRTWRHPYRCVSSSYLARLVDWTLVANGIFVLMCANGVRSALTVSTSVTAALTFLNVSCFVIVSVAGLSVLVVWQFYPATARKRGVCWPTNPRMKEIASFEAKLAVWVETITNAKQTILEALVVAPSMRSIDELQATLEQIEACCQEATDCNHLFMDQLYELSLYVYELYVEAMASNPFHRISFPAKELETLGGILQRRSDRHVLLSSRSRRILKKLGIAETWIRRHRSPSTQIDSMEAIKEIDPQLY